MGLCFGYVMETMLITQGCFSCSCAVLTKHSRVLLPLNPPVRRLEVHKELGRDTAGAGDPNTPKAYSRPLTQYTQNKKLGKEVKVGYSEWLCLFPEVTVRLRWRPVFLEMSEHLSVCGKWRMNSLVCFPCAQLFLLYLTVFISTHVFFHFYFSVSLPQEGSEWEALWGLVAAWG